MDEGEDVLRDAGGGYYADCEEYEIAVVHGGCRERIQCSPGCVNWV